MEWRSFSASSADHHATFLAQADQHGHEVRTDVYVVWSPFDGKPVSSAFNLKLRWGHALELKTRLKRREDGAELWSRAERIGLPKDSKPELRTLRELMEASGEKDMREAAIEMAAAPHVYFLDVHKVRARNGWLEKTSIRVTFEDGSSCYYVSHCFEGRVDKVDPATAKLIASGEIMGGYNNFLLTAIAQHGKTKVIEKL
jgi:hypothetical protein